MGGRERAVLVVLSGATVAVLAAGCGISGGPSGVTASSTDGASSELAASRNDAAALDGYADELGLVMIRSRGPEPEAYARQVDGPGPGVETLVAATTDGAAEIVLRLRQERTDCDLFGSACDPYQVSACYRWRFDDRMDEHEPERLEECPDGPVIDLGPAAVEPRLPAALVDRLTARLTAADEVSEAALLRQVREIYAAAVRADLARPGVEREHLIGVDEALGAGSPATVGEAVGVAVGRGTECVLVRVTPEAVDVWVPDRVSLMPGEVGCQASGQLTLLED